MKPNEIADGKYNHIDVICYLQGKPKSSIKKYLDEIVGEACLFSVLGSIQDHHKARLLFDIVELVSEALLPNYPSRQRAGYQNPQVGGGVSQPVDFPQEKQVDTAALPREFKTDQAITYWQKLYEANFVTRDCKPLGTKKQMALIAAEFSHAMGWKTIYKPFAELWGHNNKSMQEAVRRIRNSNREEWQVVIENIFKTQQNNNTTPTL